MNSATTTPANNRIPNKLEDAPPFGDGSMPIKEERMFAMLAHLCPLIIWLWKRNASKVIDAHGKEALNFGITVLICYIPISIIASFMGSLVARMVGLGLMGVNLCVIALVIYAMVQARNGKLLRYPINFRLIK